MPGTHGTGNREKKGVIFDMDNTLFDFIEAKLSACNAIVDCLGAGDPEDIFGYRLYGNVAAPEHVIPIHTEHPEMFP